MADPQDEIDAHTGLGEYSTVPGKQVPVAFSTGNTD